jgi:hypothetical protein
MIKIEASAKLTANLRAAQLRPTFTNAVLQPMMLKSAAKTVPVIEREVRVYPRASGKPLARWYVRDEMPYSNGKGVPGGIRKVQPFLSKFKSLAQAYYVTQVLAVNGMIPYKRGGTLGNSITGVAKELDRGGTGVMVVVGSNVPYAKLVIGGEGEQSQYHAGTWESLEKRIERVLPKVKRVYERALMDEIRAFLKTASY